MGHYTVWRFQSVDGKDVRVVVRASEPDDMKYQHEYQRVIWRGSAANKAAAYDAYSVQ